ncbi:UNVERIFIED_CONTAM: hypothetical protein HDU68_010934 [Siphonaria sp. JEL0065]|nr:hypothetical protein HDU68_010934 [Siphonaria sp. JEL0065]
MIVGTPNNTLSVLANSSLFPGLNESQLKSVASEMQLQTFNKGETLYKEGDKASYLFLITDGSVDVFKKVDAEDAKSEDVKLITLGVGEYVGESMVSNLPINATIIAAQDETSTLRLEHEAFSALLKQHPALMESLLKGLSHQLRTFRTVLTSTLAKNGSKVISSDAKSAAKVINIAVFDFMKHEKISFEAAVANLQATLPADTQVHARYFEPKLDMSTARLAAGCQAVCIFVNDTASAEVLTLLKTMGIQLVALRCAGFDMIDLKAAKALDIDVARVPAYSPYAVAEFAAALAMALNRKIVPASLRVRQGNFSLAGLVGFDFHGKTVGIIGTGKIGQCFIKIMLGYGCKVVCYDAYPSKEVATWENVKYVTLDELYAQSRIISLHAPLLPETKHMINAESLAKMQKGVVLINTSRGGLVDTQSLINALKSGHVSSAGLDVYENEKALFFEDHSLTIMEDDSYVRLMSFPNVIVTGHQAFLTEEALEKIGSVTMENVRQRFVDGKRGKELENAVFGTGQVRGHSLENARSHCPSVHDPAAIDAAIALANSPKWIWAKKYREWTFESLARLQEAASGVPTLQQTHVPVQSPKTPQSPPVNPPPPQMSIAEGIQLNQINLMRLKTHHELPNMTTLSLGPSDDPLPEFGELDISSSSSSSPAVADTVGLTATDIAGFFHSNCDLQLRLMRDKRREDRKSNEISVLTAALFSRGNKWESHLATILRDANLLLEYSASQDLLALIQNDERKLFFVTGFAMNPPSNLFRTTIRALKPDFIRVSKPSNSALIEFAVIDAKISHVLKVSHQIQISLYATCLKVKFKDSANVVIEDEAQVWISPVSGKDAWPKSFGDIENATSKFSVKTVIPILEKLLNNHVPRVLSERLEAVEWGVGNRCQGCEFERGCVDRARVTGDVSLIGGTKGKERTALRRVVGLFRSKNGNVQGSFEFPATLSAAKWNESWKRELEKKNSGVLLYSYGANDLLDLGVAIRSPWFNTNLAEQHPVIAHTGYKLLSMERMSVRNESPVIKAVLENSVQPLGRPCFNFPLSEDHAICMSFLQDPETDKTIGVSLCHSSNGSILFSQTAHGKPLCIEFVSMLSLRIKHLLALEPPPTVQFYVFSRGEKEIPLKLLLECFNYEIEQHDLQLCIGALLDHPDVLLAPIFPPLLITREKLIGSLARKKKADLEWYLRILENADSFNNSSTVEGLKAEITRITNDGISVAWIPRIACLDAVLKATLAMPITRVTLGECVRVLLGSDAPEIVSADEAYLYWKTGKLETLCAVLSVWSSVQVDLCSAIRSKIAADYNLEKVLVNELSSFAVVELDLCKDPALSRLLFQTQYEMLKDLQTIKESRFDKFGACQLKYLKSGSEAFTQEFQVESGSSSIQSYLNNSSTSDYKFYDWILVDTAATDSVAPKFDDLKYYNQYFMSLSLGDVEKKQFGSVLAFAEVVRLENGIATLATRVAGGQGFTYKSKTFHLYRRFIDFNTQKVVHGLMNVEIERIKRIQAGSPDLPLYLRLLKNGNNNNELISVPTAQLDLAQESVLNDKYTNSPFNLLPSQRRALQGICQNVLSLVWGPPGNGKTHTLAVSSLRMIEIAQRVGRKCRILMTAFTHAAITTFEEKVKTLLCLSGCGVGNGLRVFNLKEDQDAVGGLIESCETCIVVGTVWAISKLLEKTPSLKGGFDMLVIDEGSQFLTSFGAIAFQAVDSMTTDVSTKRVVIAGDHFQLGPILKQSYPQPKGNQKPIFGSILECLMFGNAKCTFMLVENFRFVTQLCGFTQQLYVGTEREASGQFSPFNASQPLVRNGLLEWIKNPTFGMEKIMNASLESSLVTIQLPNHQNQTDASLDSDNLEWHIHQEAFLVAQIVLCFHSCLPTARIFVITPHRLQRNILQNMLKVHAQNVGTCLLRIDTVERMQGDQADIVIACYGFTGHWLTLENELDFVYDIRRINVALSRAKALCILVSSRHLFEPPAHVLGNASSRMGLTHMKRFRESSVVVFEK